MVDHTSSSLVYRILSANTLFRDPNSVYVVQSDASGTDGYGYYHSYLNSKDLQYISKGRKLGQLNVV